MAYVVVAAGYVAYRIGHLRRPSLSPPWALAVVKTSRTEPNQLDNHVISFGYEQKKKKEKRKKC